MNLRPRVWKTEVNEILLILLNTLHMQINIIIITLTQYHSMSLRKICHLWLTTLLPYEDKVKSSSLAYNRSETRDKRPLGRDPGRSWCHLHARVKPFWSQPMAPWISATALHSITLVSRFHQLLSGSLPNGR